MVNERCEKCRHLNHKAEVMPDRGRCRVYDKIRFYDEGWACPAFSERLSLEALRARYPELCGVIRGTHGGYCNGQTAWAQLLELAGVEDE